MVVGNEFTVVAEWSDGRLHRGDSGTGKALGHRSVPRADQIHLFDHSIATPPRLEAIKASSQVLSPQDHTPYNTSRQVT